MPRLKRKSRFPEPEPDVEVIPYSEVEMEAFLLEEAWKLSSKGNLWRDWNDSRVSVFKRADGQFAFSIAAKDGVEFSPGGFETADAAIMALGEALGIKS
ncbi:MAG: hypothetical protein ACYTG0_10955 [Planctomycetota bacterium]|jgi:hypothetical protein